MNVYFSPIVWDKKIKYIFGSESISVTVDDITDEFYFGNLKEDDENISDILTATLAHPIVSVEIVNDEIYVVGEAKSHCVYESLNQILEFFKSRPDVTSKITILEDCMSSIPSYEAATDAAFDSFKTTYKVNIKKSTDIVL